MNLDAIRKDLEEFLSERKLTLFEMNYHKKDQTLEVLIDEDISLDDLEQVSNEISAFLDKYDDEFAGTYILDVSHVGAERPIRNEAELLKAIGSYIYVKSKDSEYYGTLKSYEEGILSLEVKDKTKTNRVSVPYAKTKKVRYAVEF